MVDLTPILLPRLCSPEAHVALLSDEPVLAVTLLTIASRYRYPSDIDDLRQSRVIHDRLWLHLQGVIRSLVQSEKVAARLRGKLNTPCATPVDSTTPEDSDGNSRLDYDNLIGLGTIESLLLLTDWHPRGFDSLLEEYDDLSVGGEQNQTPKSPSQNQPPSGWTDQVSRSDRTCSLVLSIATSVAHILGIFNDTLADDAGNLRDERFRARASRLKALLHIYRTQLSTRFSRNSDERTVSAALEGGQGTPNANMNLLSIISRDESIELADQVNSFWLCIISTVSAGTQTLFSSRRHTSEIIRNGGYVKMMQDFAPIVTKFRQEFRNSKMPPLIKNVLAIEFEFMRMHINSLALQAITERYVHKESSIGPPAQLSLDDCTPEDRHFVRDIANGCRDMLQSVVYGLIPGNHLRHTPIRIYFRIAGGIMLLLRTFQLGAPLRDVMTSISLVNATVEALQNCELDQDHLASSLVGLLKPLPEELRRRFVPLPVMRDVGSGYCDPQQTITPAAVTSPTATFIEQLNGGPTSTTTSSDLQYLTSVCTGLSGFCQNSVNDFRSAPTDPDPDIEMEDGLGMIGVEGLNPDWLEMLNG
ncbi:hypothetical protein ACJ41O_003102 [Fusarium nematophilum]